MALALPARGVPGGWLTSALAVSGAALFGAWVSPSPLKDIDGGQLLSQGQEAFRVAYRSIKIKVRFLESDGM